MNILFICETFTKILPTSLCLMSVVNEGVKRGHRCRVVSALGVVFDSNLSLEYKNSSDLESENVCGGFLTSVKYRITPFLRYFTWPKEPSSDLKIFYQTVSNEIESDCPAIIICSVSSFQSICIGSKIKENYPNIKYVPYFLDSILGGAKLRILPKFLHTHRALKWEGKYLYNADSIVMMKYVEKRYRSLPRIPSYFKKIKFLDLPLYNPVNKAYDVGHKYFKVDSINIFFAGSMPKKIRDPKFFISVFRKVRISDLNLYIAGTSDYQEELEKFAENDNRVHLLGVIPHEQVLEMLSEADVLLSIGNNLDCMIPSKIFEYMSTGKPILATFKRETDQCVSYFALYKNCILLDEKMDEDAASAQIESFLKGVNNNHHPVYVESLHDNTPSAFWEHITTL